MPATPATTLIWASREVCEGVSEIVAFGLAMFFLRHHQCKIQNAKCKQCITCTDSKLRFDDDSPENPGDLLRVCASSFSSGEESSSRAAKIRNQYAASRASRARFRHT